jgi:hypothetical protein
MDPAEAPKPRFPRTAGVLLLAAFALAAAWFTFRSPPLSQEPAGVWDYIRRKVLEGDGEAPWRMMLPEARPKFIDFVRQNAEAPDTDQRAAEWRRKTGLSRQDLKTLPPEKIMAREYLANVDRIRGSRVFRTEPWPGERAFLSISLKDAGDVHFVVRRADGAWRIADLIPLVTPDGYYTAFPGAVPEKVPAPK